MSPSWWWWFSLWWLVMVMVIYSGDVGFCAFYDTVSFKLRIHSHRDDWLAPLLLNLRQTQVLKPKFSTLSPPFIIHNHHCIIASLTPSTLERGEKEWQMVDTLNVFQSKKVVTHARAKFFLGGMRKIWFMRLQHSPINHDPKEINWKNLNIKSIRLLD